MLSKDFLTKKIVFKIKNKATSVAIIINKQLYLLLQLYYSSVSYLPFLYLVFPLYQSPNSLLPLFILPFSYGVGSPFLAVFKISLLWSSSTSLISLKAKS